MEFDDYFGLGEAHRLFREMFESPVARLQEQFRRNDELLRSVSFSSEIERAFQDATQWQGQFDSALSAAVSGIEEFTKLSDNFADPFATAVSAFVAATSSINEEATRMLAGLDSLRAYDTAADILSAAGPGFQALNQQLALASGTSPSFAEEVLGSVKALRDEGAGIDELASVPIQAIRERAHQLSPSAVGTDGLLGLLLMFLFFALSVELNTESESRIKEHTSKEVQAAIEELSALVPQLREDGRYYAVLRPLRLRTGPSTDHEVIAMLSPNSRVEELDREGLWLKVESFDYVEGVLQTGWVFKRYLEQVSIPEGL